VLTMDVRAEMRQLFERLSAWLGPAVGLPEDDAEIDYAAAVAVVDAAGRSLDRIAQRGGAELPSGVLAEVQALHELERRLTALQLDRSGDSLRSLTRVLPRLESATSSVPELVALAPQLICELGFDRGLISRVTDNVWHPELMYVMGDPEWAATILEAGKTDPLELVPGLHEYELARTGQAILVTEAQSRRDGTWGHPGMVQASRTHSYVAAPILSDGRLVGILHGDRYGQRRDVDELDRDLLAAFARASAWCSAGPS